MKNLIRFALFGVFTISSAFAANPTCDQWVEMLKANITSSSELQILMAKLPELRALCSNPKMAEKQIFDALWKLEQAKRLDPTVKALIKRVKAENKIPQLATVSEDFAVATLALAIRSELYDRGYYNRGFIFSGWEQITKYQEELLNRYPKVSSFKSEGFKAIFQHLTGMPMTTLTNSKVLNRNGEAYAKRLELIRNAKTSIKLMTWGFYDDHTGAQVANDLIAAHQRGVKVQILVDGLVAQRPGYNSYLGRMKNAGIEIVFWKSAVNPFYGMHSKMLIVDDQYCIDGGRNIGKYYLEDGKWSDLDVYFEGPLAQVINPNLFAQLWNEQIKLQRLSYEDIVPASLNNLPRGNTGTFLAHPQFKATDTISNLTIYAIMSARREIDIANAYFISSPGIKKALVNAIKRGVRVRIYSNSMQSVDEPIVSIPMQKSLNEMFQAGAEIYIKTGQTLHTKIFRADDLSWFGSYNLHPRSGRYELEKVTVTTDYAVTSELDRAFKDSLRQGKRVTRIEELAYPNGAGLDILFSVIFNQL